MEINTRSNRLFLALFLSLLLAALSYYLHAKAKAEELWGYWPLAFMLLGWGAKLSLVSTRFAHLPKAGEMLLMSSLTGLLLALGFMPLPFAPAMALAFLPLLWVEHRLGKDGKARKWPVFQFAFNAFLLWNILSTFWVLNASFFAGILANTLNAAFMALVFTAYHATRIQHNTFIGSLALIAYWISFEWLHHQWELTWPWLSLGNSFAHLPWLVQWYEYTGIFGGSLWILSLNLLLWQAFRQNLEQDNQTFSLRQTLKKALLQPAFLLCFFLPPAISLTLYYQYEETGPEIEVLSVQPNLEPHYQKFRFNNEEVFELHRNLIMPQLDQNLDYILFPETSFDQIQTNKLQDQTYLARLRTLLEAYPQLRLITGIGAYRIYDANKETLPKTGLRRQCGNEGKCIYYQAYNSAIQLQASPDTTPIYHKSKLVPGAENLPFVGDIALFKDLILSMGGLTGEGLTTQAERSSFRGPKANVAPMICYESVFGEFAAGYVRQGAQAFFVLTNDGWWDKTPGHVQHLHLASLRAIEYRRAVVRSANTGISAFINQKGEILKTLPYNQVGSLRAKIQLNANKTFYLRYGDLTARIALLLAGLILLSMFVRQLPNQGRRQL